MFMEDLIYHNLTMPRQIESYAKFSGANCKSSGESSRTFSTMLITVMVVATLFGLKVSSDAFDQVLKIDRSMQEQSKLCLAEFKQKNCDSLRLSA